MISWVFSCAFRVLLEVLIIGSSRRLCSSHVLHPIGLQNKHLQNSLVQFGFVGHQTPKSKVNGPRVHFSYNHKQDPRSTREDPRYRANSKHEDRNQAGRKITKKRAHRSDRTLDRTLGKRPDASRKQPDALIKRLGNRRRQHRLDTGSSDRTLHQMLAANRPDVGQQSPVEYREVLEQ